MWTAVYFKNKGPRKAVAAVTAEENVDLNHL